MVFKGDSSTGHAQFEFSQSQVYTKSNDCCFEHFKFKDSITYQ